MRYRALTIRSRVGGVAFGLFLFLLYFGTLLEQSNDVEKNPGPGPQKTGDGMRQTRLNSGSRRNSVDRNPPVEPTVTDNAKAVSGEREVSVSEPTLRDVMSKLMNMDSKFDGMKNDVNDMKEAYSNLRDEVHGMREAVSELRQENEALKEQNSSLQSKLESLERKTDDLECRSKRNNIIIHGISRSGSEDCEGLVQDMLTDQLELSETVQFDRVHRLSGKPNAPIIARCTFYKDKVKILKEKGKLKGSTVFIGEDFSSRVREIRKKLTVHLRQAKAANKRATMVYDHLLIEGDKFVLDDKDALKKIE